MMNNDASSPSAKIRSFTDLVAWREAHKLVLMIYSVTKRFPKEEMFCLTSQLRRAVVSITSNIAEGFSRTSNADKRHFYSLSSSSNCEVQNQILIARDVHYLTQQEFTMIADQTVVVGKLIHDLMRSIRNRM